MKFAMTALCCERILVKCETEVTGIKAGLVVDCGVPEPEPEPEACACDATVERSPAASELVDGVEFPETGGVG